MPTRRDLLKGAAVAAGAAAGLSPYSKPSLTALPVAAVSPLSPWAQPLPPLRLTEFPQPLPPSSTPTVVAFVICVEPVANVHRGWFTVRSSGVTETLTAFAIPGDPQQHIGVLRLGSVEPNTGGLLVALQIAEMGKNDNTIGPTPLGFKVPQGMYRVELRRDDGTVVASVLTGVQSC